MFDGSAPRVSMPVTDGGFRQWVPPELERRSGQRRRNEDPDEVRRAAREAGFAEGLKAAEAEALAQRRALAQQFDALLETFARPLNRLDAKIEAALADLAVVIARNLLHCELSLDPGKIAAVITDAVEAMPLNDRALRVQLHPDDTAFAHELLDAGAGDRQVSVQSCPELGRGDCRVEGEFAAVDASVEARVQALVEQLYAGLEHE